MRKRTNLFIVLLISMFLFSGHVIQAGQMERVSPDINGNKPNLGKSLKIPLPGKKEAGKEFIRDREYGKTPLYFTHNKGQVNKKAAFYAATSAYTLWVTAEGLVFDSSRRLPGHNEADPFKGGGAFDSSAVSSKYERDVSRLVFKNANKKPVMVPIEETGHRMNFFKGKDRSQWYRNVPTSKAVRYQELYKNIDLKVYGVEKQIEYDWIVKRGGRVEDIVFEYNEVKGTRIDEKGNLVVTTAFGDLIHQRPVSFQFIDGKKVPVNVVFKKMGKHSYGFKAGKYDKGYDLIIDPFVLAYSTYLGGSEDGSVTGLAVDGEKCAYIVGNIYSTDFPNQEESGTSLSGYISKLSPSGNEIVFTTFIAPCRPHAIALGQSGSIYLTGIAYTGFPTVAPFQSTFGGQEDAFITKLSSDGSQIIFSTFLGRSDGDAGNDIELDSSGNIYITGYTKSTGFPVTDTAFQKDVKLIDAFVCKFSPDCLTLLYSTVIGGAGDDRAYGLAVGQDGSMHIVGNTDSYDFPVSTNAFHRYNRSTSTYKIDGFVAKFSPGGTALVYASYIGGNKRDSCNDIDVDKYGYAYITGETYSDAYFPVTANAYRNWLAGGGDAYVSKVALDGSSLIYSTYIGGSTFDHGNSIVVHDNGACSIGGSTVSSDLPIYPFDNAIQSQYSGHWDFYAVTISPNGANLIMSTYIGGSDIDSTFAGIALDGDEDIYIAGSTLSTDFPLRNPCQDTFEGESEIIVAKIASSNAAPFLTLLSPNGSEILLQGESTKIRWDYQGIPVDTKIKLTLIKNGQPLGVIADNINVSATSYAWNAGNYGAQTAPTGTDYRIKIETSSGSYSDSSNSDFHIITPYITVENPNGGNLWFLGESNRITWDYAGFDDDDTISIKIYKGGYLLGTIADNVPINSRLYPWITGTYTNGTAVPGSDYKIEIQTSGGYNDLSDTNFNIGSPSITVTSPNGAEELPVSTTQTITWTWQGVIGNVNIQLSTTGVNGPYTAIASNTPNTGTYSWSVPDIESTDCFIRITSMDGTILDTSDYAFTILAIPMITITAPNGSENFVAGTTQEITWTWVKMTGNVRILLMENGAVAHDFGSAPVTDNHLTWNIPTDFPISDGYRIRINQDTVVDYSDNMFAVVKIDSQPDFNNDGKPDLLLRHTGTGSNQVWYMDGDVISGSASLTAITNTNWFFEGTGDFNGDGKPDILLRERQTGANQIWLMDGITKTASVMLPTIPDTNWHVGAVEDFNNDGKPDIILRNQNTGDNQVWFMDGTTKSGQAAMASIPDVNWRFCGAADLNNDGKPDLVMRNYSSGSNQVWFMDGHVRTSTDFLPSIPDTNWQIDAAADFNLDGRPDLLLRNYSNGSNQVWYLEGITKIGQGSFPAAPDTGWTFVN